MVRTMRYVKLLPIIFSMILVFSSSAIADYSDSPHQFYGDVIVNGVAAPDNVLVSAKFNGKDVEGGLTNDGMYGYGYPAFIVAMHPQYVGQTVEFYVQNEKAAEYDFAEGGITELHLSVEIPNFCGDTKCESGESCASCALDCGACALPQGGSPPSGGPAPPGGVVIVPNDDDEPTEPQECTEDWICTDWSECFNSKQSRTCADTSRCGTEESKPAEKQECEMPTICEAEEKTCLGNILSSCSPSGTSWTTVEECENGCSNGRCVDGGFDFTGMITGSPALIGGGVVVLIILAGLLYAFKFKKK